jgi:diguanylate cyclase (GGDEF)-like protein
VSERHLKILVVHGDSVEGQGCRDEIRRSRPHYAVDVVAKTRDYACHLPSIVRLNAERSRLLGEIESQRRQLLEIAGSDELTGLANRRRFNEVLDLEVERAQRFHRALTLVLFDLDALKLVNDTHGHPGGDAAIRHIALCLKAEIRRYEVAARIGGDEFAVLLVDTNFDQGRFVAEKLRSRIADATVPGIGQVTISAGVAAIPAHAQTAPELVRIADQALYEAKRAGRNRVAVSRDVREERSGERHPIRFRVVVSGRDTLGETFSEETETELVSRQGARIVSTRTVAAGEKIRLRTPFHAAPLTARVTACYRGLDERWHVGFKLVDPPKWGA